MDAAGQVTGLSDLEGSLDADETDLADLVRGNSTFAFDLYRVLKKEDDSLFFSPYSISLALATVYEGARAEPDQQMADTLHFFLPPERLHPAFNDLYVDLASRGRGSQGQEDQGFRLNIVNALWGQEGYGFLEELLGLLDVYYNAGLRQLDFAAAPEEARLTINGWVSDQTEERIQDLVPPGLIDASTVLVLTKAIYFNAAWSEQFDPGLTWDDTFYLLDGGEVSVPMMRQTESLGYAYGDGVQAIELLYDDWETSMVTLIPDTGEFEGFEAALDAGMVDATLESLEYRRIALRMPRFTMDSDFSLGDALSKLGMPVAFSAGADFSGITGTRELVISDVLHRAFVSVDETGTEAPAATAVIMPRGAAPEEPLELTINRPFVFLIRDSTTGTILFVGRVLNPVP